MSITVVDANLVVSAALNPNGTPRAAQLAARTRGLIALSDDVYVGSTRILGRPKFARVIGTDRRLEILELLTAAAAW